MTSPQIGTRAPTFSLSDQDGKPVNLADYLGQLVVIYFYPKALTSGCTVQACGIRDNWQILKKKGVTVFGISPDSPKLLNKFKDEEQLPFPLLSDPDHRVADMYGTWQEKSMYGRKYMGMARNSYVLDRSGMIIGVLQKVKPVTHIDDIMAIIDGHTGQGA